MHCSLCKLDSINHHFSFERVNCSLQTKVIACVATFFAGLLINEASRNFLYRVVKWSTSSLPPFKTLFSYRVHYWEIEKTINENFDAGCSRAIEELTPEEVLHLALKSIVPAQIDDNKKLQEETDQIIRTFDPNTSSLKQTPIEKRASLVYHFASQLSLLISDITGSFFDIPDLIHKVQSYPKNLASVLFAFSLPISFHYLWKTLRPIFETIFGDLELFEQTHLRKFTLLALFITVVTYLCMRNEKAKSIIDYGEKFRFNQFPHMHLDEIPSFTKKIEEVRTAIRARSHILIWHEEGAKGSLSYFLKTLSEIALTGRRGFNEEMFHCWEVDLTNIIARCTSLEEVQDEWNKLVTRVHQAGNPYLYIPDYFRFVQSSDDKSISSGPESLEQRLAKRMKDDVTHRKIRLITTGTRQDNENMAHSNTFFSRIQVPYVTPRDLEEVMKQVYCPRDRWDAICIKNRVVNALIGIGERFELAPELPEEFHEHIFDAFRGIEGSRQVLPMLKDCVIYDWSEVDDLLFMMAKYQIAFEEDEFLTNLNQEFSGKISYQERRILDEQGKIREEWRNEFLNLYKTTQQKLEQTGAENFRIWNRIQEGWGKKLDAYRELKNQLLERWWIYRQNNQSMSIPLVRETAKKLCLLDKVFMPELQKKIKEEKKNLKGFATTASYNEIIERLQEHEKNLLGFPTVRELRRLWHLSDILNTRIRRRPEVVDEVIKNINQWRQRATDSDRKSTGPVFVFVGPPGTGKSTAAEEIATALQSTHRLVEAPLRDNYKSWNVPSFYRKGRLDKKMLKEIVQFIRDKKTGIVILEEFDIIEDREAIKQILELIGDASMHITPPDSHTDEETVREEVDRRNIIFILNANFADLKLEGDFQANKKLVEDNVRIKYGKEGAFIDRLWEIIPFSPLTGEVIAEYIDLYFQGAIESYKVLKGTVDVDDTVKEHFLSEAYNSINKLSLRSLKRNIERFVADKLFRNIPLSLKPWKAILTLDECRIEEEPLLPLLK